MLQAMNTGHDGSMSTGHANSPTRHALRLETMVLMAGVDLPVRAIREQIASAVDIIVQQSRLKDGTRKIVNITEVQGMEGDVIVMQDVFVFEQTGVVEGKIQGRLKPTGIRPKFVESSGPGHPPAAGPVRRQLLAGTGRPQLVDTMTIVIAAVAALAILLIAFGVAMSGGGSDVNARLARYASTARGEAQGGRQATRASLRRSSRARRWRSSTRSWSSATSAPTGPRDRARRPAAQAVRVPRHLGRHDDLGVPLAMLMLSVFVPTLGNPLFLVIGLLIGFMLPRFLAQAQEVRPAQVVQQAAAEHDHPDRECPRAGSSFLQAVELVVRESRPPISTEFGRVIREVNLGLSFEVALENMVRRVARMTWS